MRARPLFLSLALLGVAGLPARSAEKPATENPGKAKLAVSIKPQHVADALKAIIVSHREVYAGVAANAGADAGKGLPNHCELLRKESEAVASKGVEYSYLLRSLHPINKRNSPETVIEILGLQAVAKDPEAAFYSEELLGGRWYLTAVYPDVAVNQSCVTCHNQQQAVTRRAWKEGEVMGGLVIRIALEL